MAIGELSRTKILASDTDRNVIIQLSQNEGYQDLSAEITATCISDPTKKETYLIVQKAWELGLTFEKGKSPTKEGDTYIIPRGGGTYRLQITGMRKDSWELTDSGTGKLEANTGTFPALTPTRTVAYTVPAATSVNPTNGVITLTVGGTTDTISLAYQQEGAIATISVSPNSWNAPPESSGTTGFSVISNDDVILEMKK